MTQTGILDRELIARLEDFAAGTIHVHNLAVTLLGGEDLIGRLAGGICHPDNLAPLFQKNRIGAVGIGCHSRVAEA